MFNGDRGGKWRWRGAGLAGAAVVAAGLLGSGCEPKKAEHALPPPAPLTFAGPTHLHGTIGSMVSLRGYEPLLVSGYGLVLGLPRTGSSDPPSFLRQWLLTKMRAEGFGSAKLGTANIPPELIIASNTSASVVIEGLVPPGAVKGTRFDVLVSALPGTQTTSLEGGNLPRWELSENGANPELRFSRTLATADGPTYLNPLGDETKVSNTTELERTAVILGGGKVTTPRIVELVLNQPAYNRSRMIVDRINDKFGDILRDRVKVAVGVSDAVIRINVPERHAQRPEELLELISRTFIQRSPDFEPQKARQMGELLRANNALARDTCLVWQTLGQIALPVISEYYTDPNPVVRFAALEAGIKLGDLNTLGDEDRPGRLLDMARDPSPANRARVADLLANLPDNTRAVRALRELLDDPEKPVRIAAYESLAEANNPLLKRYDFSIDGSRKFILDLVPSSRPMVYIAHAKAPRVVIFNPNLAFKLPMMARLWNNRLMFRQDDPSAPLEVYYQAAGEQEGKRVPIAAPSVASVVYVLGHRTTFERPTPAFDLSYSQIVNALARLSREGWIPGDFEVQSSPLADIVAKAKSGGPRQRPESDPAPGVPAPGLPGDAAPATPTQPASPDANPQARPAAPDPGPSKRTRDEAQPPVVVPLN